MIDYFIYFFAEYREPLIWLVLWIVGIASFVNHACKRNLP